MKQPPTYKPPQPHAPQLGPKDASAKARIRQHQRDLPTNSTRWRRIRRMQLNEEPLCRECKAEGQITEATEVDHKDGDDSNHDPSNLQSLCKSHHSSKTAREQAQPR